MKRLTLSLLSILLVAALTTPIVLADDEYSSEIWTITADPNFVFSGDPINITVMEMMAGERWVVLNLRAPNGTVVAEGICQTSDLGVGTTTLETNIEYESGLYNLEAVDQGIIVANATIELIQDDINWLHTLILEDRDTIDQMAPMIVFLNQKSRAQAQTISDLWTILIVVSIAAIVVFLVNFFLFKPWLSWKVARTSGGVVNKGLKFFLHPPADGDMTPFMESARATQDKVLSEREDAPAPPKSKIGEDGGASGNMEFEVREDDAMPNKPFGRLFRRGQRTREPRVRAEPKAKRVRNEWTLFGQRPQKRGHKPRYQAGEFAQMDAAYEDDANTIAYEPRKMLKRGDARGSAFDLPEFLLTESEKEEATNDIPTIPLTREIPTPSKEKPVQRPVQKPIHVSHNNPARAVAEYMDAHPKTVAPAPPAAAPRQEATYEMVSYDVNGDERVEQMRESRPIPAPAPVKKPEMPRNAKPRPSNVKPRATSMYVRNQVKRTVKQE